MQLQMQMQAQDAYFVVPRCKLLQVGLEATFLNNLWINLSLVRRPELGTPFRSQTVSLNHDSVTSSKLTKVEDFRFGSGL